MSRKTIQVNVCVEFKNNLDKLYPHTNGIRKKTEQLNKLLEEILYGTKKT